MAEENKKPWVALHFDRPDQRGIKAMLGEEKLEDVLGRCLVFDIKKGNEVFKSYWVSVNNISETIPFPDHQEVVAISLDGLRLQSFDDIDDEVFLREDNTTSDKIVAEQKEKARQEKIAALLERKAGIERQLAALGYRK